METDQLSPSDCERLPLQFQSKVSATPQSVFESGIQAGQFSRSPFSFFIGARLHNDPNHVPQIQRRGPPTSSYSGAGTTLEFAPGINSFLRRATFSEISLCSSIQWPRKPASKKRSDHCAKTSCSPLRKHRQRVAVPRLQPPA